jgi:predicted nucleic acid-binding protein
VTPVAVLDACALVPYHLTNVLLAFAEAELFEPRWSERIVAEATRALTLKLGLPPEKVAKRMDAMGGAFPEAAVAGFEPLEAALLCDPKDRHVLAAAIAGGAQRIVTFNLKDFPEAACGQHGVEAVHPDRFLLGLLAGNPVDAVAALEECASVLVNPAMTPGQVLSQMAGAAPGFTGAMRQIIEG